MKKIWPFLILMTIIGGCASKPVLYPNSTYKKRGEEAAQKDVDRCMADSERYLKSKKGKQAAKGGAFGAVVGGAMGAVSGVFRGDVAGGLARGAAVGGAGGTAAGAMSPDQIKRNYVNHCLGKRGYRIIGWD